MYNQIKKILKTIIPSNFLQKNEIAFRKIYATFYSGNNFKCNICDKNLSQFVKNQRNEKLCPNCGSIERDRKLWHLLETSLLKDDLNVLDFSPSRSLGRKLKNIPRINYFSTDLSGNFIADYKYDITKIENNVLFDLIICFHILEHIIEDKKAMSELYRVLNNNGKVVIQTPFKDGEIYEDYSIISEKERLQHFGQEDHVRVYSKQGLKERLESVGFFIEIKEFNDEENNKNGFSRNETIFIAEKK